MQVLRILMVCLGNICRSPLAKAILTEKLKKRKIHAVVDSAGTESYHIGELPDPRTITVAADHGIDISHYRARQVTTSDFDKFDIIYVTDNDNFNRVMRLARNEKDKQKVKFLLDELFPGKQKGVPDPWYGGEEGFEEVFQLLENACEKVAERMAKDKLTMNASQ